mmetsp:Transcript_5738/g.12513  ORF Transcript_5738/g.12513 Transcript_5738/m.12513 type:complete len:436 (+) Transcript_5738:88-1395(+)
MWNNSTAGSANYYGHQPQQQQQPPSIHGQPSSSSAPPPPSSSNQNTSGQKHDIFVGNLAFSTTEEQLYAAFSELGRIIKIRMVSDLETGKPRGFAFIEFEDPQAALSAIRNMNEYEINGRKIRVNFSNSSHLETLANQLGMDLSHVTGPNKNKGDHHGGGGGGHGGGGGSGGSGMNHGQEDKSSGGGGHHHGGGGGSGVSGSKAVASALKSMNKGELYDVVAKLKEIADSNPDEARKLLTQHPQLPEAILYCMSELDMIKTPVSTNQGMGVSALPPPNLSAPPPPIPKPSDPRARSSAPPPSMPPPPPAPSQLPPPPSSMGGMPSDPRARPADPRAASRDPRAAAGGAPNFPPPPPMMQPPPAMPPPPGMQQQQQQPPPPTQQQQLPGGGGTVAGLDPSLVQQVMALTPAQISQLPPDKQASILALRQQITGIRR